MSTTLFNLSDCSALDQSGSSFASSGTNFASSFIALCFIIFFGLLIVYFWTFGVFFSLFMGYGLLIVFVFSDRERPGSGSS